MKRVLLRAAAGPSVGMGHAMRSLAVAAEVARAGGEAWLVVDDAESAAALAADGVRVWSAADLPEWCELSAVSAWLDGLRDWSPELARLAEHGTPALLVENRTPARASVRRVLYPALHHVDDVWDRAHAERVLSGPGWIPLRRAVVEAPPAAERDVDLLVTFGGSDPGGSSERVLALLADDARRIAVAVGPHMHERRARLAALVAALPNGRLLATGAELAPWMARSRAALSALGTTLVELLYHRVPTWILANYASDTQALAWYAEHGLHAPLGVAGEVSDAELAAALAQTPRALPADPLGQWRDELGRGAPRLAAVLLGGLARAVA